MLGIVERERAGKLTPPLLYFIIIFVFWEKGREGGGEAKRHALLLLPVKNHQNQNRWRSPPRREVLSQLPRIMRKLHHFSG